MTNPILLPLILLSSIVQQSFVVIGTVRDQSGQAVTNVRISVMDENFQPIRTIFVDSSGRFTVRGLSSGRYTFRAETTGTPFEEQVQRLELQSLRLRGTGSETYPIDFVLRLRKARDEATRGPLFAQEVPPTARAEYERGASSLKNNRTEVGFTALKKAIEIFSDYYDALELLGAEMVKNGEYQPAIPLLRHAIEVNSRAPKSLYALGVAHLKLNRSPEAVEWLEKSAELESNNVNTMMMLGLAHGNNQELGKSEGAFRKALQLGGAQAAEGHFYLAALLNKQERYREAWRELELYLKESKDIRDPDQIKTMIEKLKAKEKAKK